MKYVPVYTVSVIMIAMMVISFAAGRAYDRRVAKPTDITFSTKTGTVRLQCNTSLHGRGEK